MERLAVTERKPDVNVVIERYKAEMAALIEEHKASNGTVTGRLLPVMRHLSVRLPDGSYKVALDSEHKDWLKR